MTAMAPTSGETTPRTAMNPWIPTAVVMGSTVMVVLDSTIVNVALHQIGLDLRAGAGIEWVVTAYLLAVCASQPATGWLADRFGRKPVFLTSLAAFTVASVACAMSPNLGFLIAFRVLQGIGGGAIMPVGMTMLLEIFPRARHGRAMAVWGMATMVAPALGPTLGGWLVTAVNWHWLFLINLPIGIVAVVAGLRLLPDIGHRERRSFDALGLVLGGSGLSILVLGLGQGTAWGWGSAATVLCIVLGVALLTAFVRRELRCEHPLIDLRMFSEHSFRLSMAAMLFIVGAQYGRVVFIPLALESLRGFSAFKVGVLFFTPAVTTGVGMSMGGKLVDRIGPRTPILAGCAAMFVSFVIVSRFSLTTPVWFIVVVLSIQGFGMGLTASPAMIAGLSELPARLVAQGSAVRALVNQTSGALAIAILGAVVSTRMGSDPTPEHAQHAYNAAFVVTAGGILVAGFLAYRLPRSGPAVAGDPVALGAALAE